MRTKLLVIAFAMSSLFILQSRAQTAGSGFAKGELSAAKNHTDMATYGAGAKLDWHSHPGGQVLLITEGTGYYRERGKPARIVHKGDVIKSAPGVEHWHGATPSSTFAYIAVTPTQKGKTIWLEPVSDKDYNSAK
jgi:quercetin dioxygenase-like cupin family protein